MHAIMEPFFEVKAGNDPDEYEDNFATMKETIAGSPGGRAGMPRFAVADGATAGYDPAGWARQLTRSFAPGYADDSWFLKDLTRPEIVRWYRLMQERWRDQDRVFPNHFARRKFAESPACATFLGGQIDGLEGPRPRWRAMGLGDTVLFHVRAGALVRHVPELAVGDFGNNPELVSADPAARDWMGERTRHDWSGDLQLGDHLYVATDAVAAWMLRTDAERGAELWERLADIDGERTFRDLVAGERARGTMENDDATLLRIHLVARIPRLVIGYVAEPAAREAAR